MFIHVHVEFWTIVGRRTKWKMKKNILSLKSEAGVSVTSKRGKLEVLQRQLVSLVIDAERLRVI